MIAELYAGVVHGMRVGAMVNLLEQKKCTLCDFLETWWAAIGTLMVFLLLPFASSASDPPRIDVLFVASESSDTEKAIEDHLIDIDGYNVVIQNDSDIGDDTDLSLYDLIILTGFAPNVSTAGIQNIKSSRIPVLVLEYQNFSYSHQLGLVKSDVGADIDTRNVESVFKGLGEYTRYLGRDVQVYDSSHSVWGIPSNDIEAGVQPLMYSSRSFSEVSVFIDESRKIAVSGISEAAMYTSDGWRLFDLLLAGLCRGSSLSMNPDNTAQALASSGLLDYIEQVNLSPEEYTPQDVQGTVWNTIAKWNLFPLSVFIDAKLKTYLPNLILAPIEVEPYPHHPRCGQPDDLWFMGEAWYDDPEAAHDYYKCTRVYYPDCPSCTVRDRNEIVSDAGPSEYADWPSAVKQLDANWDQIYDKGVGNYYGNRHGFNTRVVRGTDLGISVSFHDKTLFYMGDSWIWWPTEAICIDSDPSDLIDECPAEAITNDAIAVSVDNDPTDGVDAVVFTEPALTNPWHTWWNDNFLEPLEPEASVGIRLAGIHTDPWDPSIWSHLPWKTNEPRYTTPTGAAVLSLPYSVSVDSPQGDTEDKTIFIDTVVVWYATAAAPKGIWKGYANCSDAKVVNPDGGVKNHRAEDDWDCNVWSTRKTPTSWVGCSWDGIHFWNCYDKFAGEYVPFSQDGFRWGTYDDCMNRRYSEYGSHLVGRFTQTDPVTIDRDEFSKMCRKGGYGENSELCVEFWEGEDYPGGLLVFGTGRPPNRSPLFLAYVEAEEFGSIHLDTEDESLNGRPIVHYYTGDGWSYYETDAAPLPLEFWNDKGMPCDDVEEYTVTRLDMIDRALDAGVIDDKFIELFNVNTDGPRKCFNKDIFFSPDDCRFNYFTEDGLGKRSNTFGIKSVKIININKQGIKPHILIFYNNRNKSHWMGETMWRPGVAYRTAPLWQPWNLSPKVKVNNLYDNHVDGYGPYIIEKFTEYVEPETVKQRGRLEIWHTISSWAGMRPPYGFLYSPYGVYTKMTKFPWPPDWPEANDQ
ncbi:MAG: hypothetical protein GY847_03410 [Proteobacteria bacterium]|nr:hypothetical protein [Pseudomonadota bacterium]